MDHHMILHAFLFCLVCFTVDGSIDEVIKASLEKTKITGYSIGEPLVAEEEGEVHLVELDILMPESKYKEYLDAKNSTTMKRKATVYENRRWTDATMPWTSSFPGFTAEQEQYVRDAMAIWSQHTCMKFEEVSTSSRKSKIHIKNGEGCNSYVGMWGGTQTVNLGEGCKSVDTALHELGHAIGLNHEQCRSDRDEHIWVRNEHIEKKWWFASDKIAASEISSFGVPYDYASIMHYGQGAFAKADEPSMITADPSWQFRIGNAKGLSFGDIKTVNLMYKCAEKAGCPSKKCPEDGFMDEHCQCICRGNPTRPCNQAKPADNQWPCEDKSDSCSYFSRQGYCDPSSMYSAYMMGNCKKTCGICGSGCSDKISDCLSRAQNGECKGNAAFMFEKCHKSCGVCWGTGASSCTDNPDESCGAYKNAGYCEPGHMYYPFMTDNCAKTCGLECQGCTDSEGSCAPRAAKGECSAMRDKKSCARSCAYQC